MNEGSLNHKVFFIEEFFGSRIYNANDQEEYFFNKEDTANIKKIFSGNYDDSIHLQKFRDNLIGKNLLSTDITYIEHEKTAGFGAPLKISFNITEKCNLRCKHCLTNAGSSNPEELTTVELFKLIDQMRRAGTFFVTIGGGEPLLRNDLFEVIAYGRKNYIAVSLVTNGILITKEVVQRLNGLVLDTITVSVDGLERNHELIRGEGTFRKTIEGLKILREYCKTAKLAMRLTLNNKNVEEYQDVIKLAEDLSLDMIRLTPMLLLGRAKENSDLLLNQKEYAKFIQKTQDIRSKIKVILPHQEDKKKFFINPTDFGCHCGKKACWISQTGDFYPCIFFGENFKAGNIRTNNYLDLWERSKAMATSRGNPTCINCADYRKCRGGCRARPLWEYGDINAIDPLCPLMKNNSKKL